MKRWFCLLIATIISISGFGCTGKNTEIMKPINVFYCRNEVSYNTEDGVLFPETREFSGFEHNMVGFLNRYLDGPQSKHLYSPFPAGSKILELKQDHDDVRVVLSRDFSLLSGYELTICCACISRTVLELTNSQNVYLHIDGEQENDSAVLVMSRDNLLLMDTTEIN